MDISSLSQSNSVGTTSFLNGAETEAQNASEKNNSVMGKDDFLKLLVTQLKYQDPTKPMEDKEFVSQMAEFTSLEQMSNMSKGFEAVSQSVNNNFALSLIGKRIEISEGESLVSGVVEEVSMGAKPQVKVNGQMYSIKNISRVGVQEVQ